jgi:triacylglycerol esterase/lipase EstA (alpha/beta hydrolase family)
MLRNTNTTRPIRTRLAAMALAALTLVGGAVASSTSTAAAAAPTSRTVLLVHGMPGPLDIFASKVDCNDAAMTAWAKGLRTRGLTNVLTVGYNNNDINCNLRVPGIANNTMNTSLDEVARELAQLIWTNYTSRGVTIAISAHSMGGLIVRRAITGVMNHDAGFPAYLYVSDVVTSGTPHFGAAVAGACALTINLQCLQMAAGLDGLPRNAFIWALSLYGNPQADTTWGTDWTLIGSWCDAAVGGASSIAMHNTRRSSIASAWPKLDVHKEVFVWGDARGCYDHLELVTKPAALNLIFRGLTTWD